VSFAAITLCVVFSYCYLFRYRLSPESFGYTLVSIGDSLTSRCMAFFEKMTVTQPVESKKYVAELHMGNKVAYNI